MPPPAALPKVEGTAHSRGQDGVQTQHLALDFRKQLKKQETLTVASLVKSRRLNRLSVSF